MTDLPYSEIRPPCSHTVREAVFRSKWIAYVEMRKKQQNQVRVHPNTRPRRWIKSL